MTENEKSEYKYQIIIVGNKYYISRHVARRIANWVRNAYKSTEMLPMDQIHTFNK